MQCGHGSHFQTGNRGKPMSQLLEVLYEHAEAMEHDERLSPDERTLVQTVSLGLLAFKTGTDIWTMEVEALAEDVALTEQQAAETKRKAGEAKRNATEAKQLASKAAR